MRRSLDNRAFTIASCVCLAATAAGAFYLAVDHRWFHAAAFTAFLVAAMIFIIQRDRLPSLFSLLFVLAGLVNTAGYLFDLWRTPTWFDESVHLYTSFTVASALGWILISRTRVDADRHAIRFVGTVTLLGLALGIFWELFEWFIGIIGTPADTAVDLVMDTFGAVAAGLFCRWAADGEERKRRRSWRTPTRQLAAPCFRPRIRTSTRG